MDISCKVHHRHIKKIHKDVSITHRWPHRSPATQVSHRVPQRLPGFRWELGWLWKKRHWIPKWLDDWWLDVTAETSQFVTRKFVEHFPILCCKSLANEEELFIHKISFWYVWCPNKNSTVNFVEAPSECSQSSSTPFFGYIFCISPIKWDERSESSLRSPTWVTLPVPYGLVEHWDITRMSPKGIMHLKTFHCRKWKIFTRPIPIPQKEETFFWLKYIRKFINSLGGCHCQVTPRNQPVLRGGEFCC